MVAVTTPKFAARDSIRAAKDANNMIHNKSKPKCGCGCEGGSEDTNSISSEDMLFFHDGENSDDEHEIRMPSKAKKLSLARPSIDKGKKMVNDANDGSCSDIENMNSPATSDCEVGLTKFPVFDEKRDMDNLKLKLGMIFKDVKVFRAALRENSIKEGYEFRLVKNDL
ncbi:hypothetical protein ACH5RR_003875 [Cinchona calisaya]|uniref:Transposase MuDR plant domain-containing protein n=1 Tax=Cinchona calisaya TaxID=153742 RepID=A0ABD3AWP8_9GENT